MIKIKKEFTYFILSNVFVILIINFFHHLDVEIAFMLGILHGIAYDRLGQKMKTIVDWA